MDKKAKPKRLWQNKIVKVFLDPITCHEIEGTATLKEYICRDSEGLEYWEVCFTDDVVLFNRWINPANH